MARKVFISFLGTNNYLQCHYIINGKISVLTRFIQEALINHYCMEWTEKKSGNKDLFKIITTLNFIDYGKVAKIHNLFKKK